MKNKRVIKQPLVSVITVVYNGEKYLDQTIQSVINQTYKNIEYIIIDGGSTDGTLDIINKYQDYISYFVSEPDNGLYDAMNKGIEAAKGELIGMINSDDWYETNAVELIVEAFINNPNKKIFHADRYNISPDGDKTVRKFNPSAFKFKYYGMTYNHPSMFITKDEYVKHLYSTTLVALSDYQFVLESFLKDCNSFYYIEHSIVNYRLDGISAQMNVFESLTEGFKSRKAAGLNFVENCFSFTLRLFLTLFFGIKRKLNR